MIVLGIIALWLVSVAGLVFVLKDARKTDMAVIQAVQDQLDRIPAQVQTAVQAALANAPLPAGAASAQDVTDTVTAVQQAVDAITTPAG